MQSLNSINTLRQIQYTHLDYVQNKYFFLFFQFEIKFDFYFSSVLVLFIDGKVDEFGARNHNNFDVEMIFARYFCEHFTGSWIESWSDFSLVIFDLNTLNAPSFVILFRFER